jgi:hypothetical protein
MNLGQPCEKSSSIAASSLLHGQSVSKEPTMHTSKARQTLTCYSPRAQALDAVPDLLHQLRMYILVDATRVQGHCQTQQIEELPRG